MRHFRRASPPCQHRGDYERHVAFNSPSGAVAAFECVLYDLCTLMKPSTEQEIRQCINCPDRKEYAA